MIFRYLQATFYVSISKVSLMAVIFAVSSVYETKGGTTCGDVLVHLFEVNNSSRNFPEASCCMFNPLMCTWESVADPTAIVNQRVEPTGRVLNGIAFHGEYHCKNVTDRMIKEKVLYLSGGTLMSVVFI